MQRLRIYEQEKGEPPKAFEEAVIPNVFIFFR